MPKSNLAGDFTCCQCNRHFPTLNNFDTSKSYLYLATGALPICQDCLRALYNHYVIQYKDRKKAMKRICMAFDIYYADSLYIAADDGKDSVMQKYIRSTRMKQYKDKTFDDTLKEGFVWDENRKKVLVSESNPAIDLTQYRPDTDIDVISDQDIEKWGPGFDNQDYNTLNSHYRYLKNANPNCDSNQEIFINDLCFTKMMQAKAAREGRVDDYNKLTESYRKSFQQAGLKTVQDETSVNEDSWSSFTSLVSQYTPEEYYRMKEAYKDFDGFDEYKERHIERPLGNIMNGTDIRDEEYYIHESEDEDDDS